MQHSFDQEHRESQWRQAPERAVVQRRAAGPEVQNPPPRLVDWVVADLDVWQLDRQFDMVCPHGEHPQGLQLAVQHDIAL